MRYLSLILLCVFTLSAQAQEAALSFRTGDHIYYMETYNDFPIHFQVGLSEQVGGHELAELTMYGKPECVLAFDPGTNNIYPPNTPILVTDSLTVISTPFLTKATSFKICTNNRIFVLVTKPTAIKNL